MIEWRGRCKEVKNALQSKRRSHPKAQTIAVHLIMHAVWGPRFGGQDRRTAPTRIECRLGRPSGRRLSALVYVYRSLNRRPWSRRLCWAGSVALFLGAANRNVNDGRPHSTRLGLIMYAPPAAQRFLVMLIYRATDTLPRLTPLTTAGADNKADMAPVYALQLLSVQASLHLPFSP